MCAVLDLCGKMVLAYRIGGDMTVLSGNGYHSGRL